MLRSYRSRLVYLLPVALLVVTSAVVGDKLDDPCAISPESCPITMRVGVWGVVCPNTSLFIETSDEDALPWNPPGHSPCRRLSISIRDPNEAEIWFRDPNDSNNPLICGSYKIMYTFSLEGVLPGAWQHDTFCTLEAWTSDGGGGSYLDTNMAHESRVVYVSTDPNCVGQVDIAYEPDCNGNGVNDGWDIRCGVSSDCDQDQTPDECENENAPVGVRITADKLVCPDTPILIETWDFDAKPWADPNVPPWRNLYIYVMPPTGGEYGPKQAWPVGICHTYTTTLASLLADLLPEDPEPCGGVYSIRASASDAGGGVYDPYDPHSSDSCTVHMFRDPTFCTGRCSGTPQTDCNGNGIDDWCEIDSGLASDCNGNEVPDDCDANTPSSGLTDCDHNGWPDQYCSPVDLVILVDTSGSMTDPNADALERGLCAVLDGLIAELRDPNIAVYPEILAMSPSFRPQDYACTSCTVPGRYGSVLKDGNNPLLRASPLETCHGTDPLIWQKDAENWGPACAVVAANKDVPECGTPWHSNAVRVIVPISDSAPRCGCGIDEEDRMAIADAAAIATAHQVTVCPIVGIDPGWVPDCHIMPTNPEDPNDGYSVFVWAKHLADGTGGDAYLLSDPNLQRSLSDYIKGKVRERCTAPPDCNGDGIPNACEIANCPTGDPDCADCNHNGIPDKCDIDYCPGDPNCDDCNHNGVPDWCDIRDCPLGDPNCADGNHNGVPDSCDAPPIVPFVVVHNALSSAWDPNDATCAASANECDLLRMDASGTQGAPASGLLFEWDLTYTGDPNHDFQPPDAYGPEFEDAWRSRGESESISIGLRISNGLPEMTKYATVQLTIVDSTPLLVSLSGPSQIVVGQLGCFVASPAVRCDDVASVTWNFGDGDPVTGTQIPADLEQRRAWTTAGVYTVTCQITDSDDDVSNMQSLTVEVTSENPPYQARATELEVERQYHVYDPNFTESSVSIRHSAQLRVKNIGEYPVRGPIHVAFEGLTPSGTEVAGGSTDPNLGAPHIQIAGAEVTLAPQQASEWTWVEWQVPIESTEPFDYDAVAYTLQLPPVFRTEPSLSVAEGEVYTYDALAEDPEGEPVYYELVAPVPTGMRINSASGLLTWPVGHSAANNSSYPITIRTHTRTRHSSWTSRP